MNISINSVFSIFLLLLSSNSLSFEEQYHFSECIEAATNAKIVKSDSVNHRIFLSKEKATIKDIDINTLNSCFKGRNLSNDWSVSIFNKSKYAGYKDDDNIIPYHKDNMWAKSYKFEYTVKDNKLISNPAINPQIVYP